jgi:hypothetical protein
MVSKQFKHKTAFSEHLIIADISSMDIKRQTFPLVTSVAVITAFAIFLIAILSTKLLHLYGRPLAFGITVDLVIVLPVIPVILSYGSPGAKYLSSLLFTVGIIIAGCVIPANEQVLLCYFKWWIVPVVELASVTFLIVKVKKALRMYSNSGHVNGDFYSELKKVAFTMVPNRIAYIVSSEIAVFYYLFFSRGKIIYSNKHFSYHKDTGTIALFGVLIFMVFVETTATHLLLAKWSAKAAWILSIISIYAALQLLGMARAFFRRPIEIKTDSLILRYGLLAETEIPIDDIEYIEAATHTGDKYPELQCLSPLRNLDSYNMIIKLRSPATISFIYGKVKTYQTIAFHVDNSILFKETLDNQIQ